MECLPCCTYPHDRHTVVVAPNEHYDEASPDQCSHGFTLRVKFLGLAAVKLWAFSPIQIIFRLSDLIQGGFYTRGYENAQHAHLSSMKSDPTIRGTPVSECSIVCYVLLELIKDVGRIVLFPLYLVSLAFSCAVGLLHAEFGRILFSLIDQLWYIHPINPDSQSGLEQWANLAAPCMQTKEFRKEMNLFRYAGNMYHAHTIRTLHTHLQKLFAKASCYFSAAEIAPLKQALENCSAINAALQNTRDGREAVALNAGQETNLVERKRIRTAIMCLEDAIGLWSINDINYQTALATIPTSLYCPSGDRLLSITGFNQPYQIRV